MAAWSDVSRQCFVVSPIGEQGSERYETFRRVLDRMIRPAIEDSGIDLEVIRADEIHRAGSFIRDVLQYLARAYVVIVDLTGQNPNVFYELGVRHALSPRTILIARTTADIPADLREYRTLIYSGTPEGDERFQRTLRNYLDEIEKTPDAPDNPVLSWLKLPEIPEDLRLTYAARLANAGRTQPDILRFIQNQSGALDAGVSQASIDDHFKRSSAEMYYRLEQLRLLGFISKERDATGAVSYRLAPGYRRELGLPEIVVRLALVRERGTMLPFGTSADAPPAHFYYVRATNCRMARLRKCRIIISRVRIFDAAGGIVEDEETKVALKWQTGANRCTARNIGARDEAVANIGFIIKGREGFQLDICDEPWPQGFPGLLGPRRSMRVDLAPEVAGAPVLSPLSLDITWDGGWNDDGAQMPQHLAIKAAAGR